MDCFTTFAMTAWRRRKLSVFGLTLHPAANHTRPAKSILVTASEARQSRGPEVMDCFTAFAMTGWRLRKLAVFCFTPQPAANHTRPSESIVVTASPPYTA